MQNNPGLKWQGISVLMLLMVSLAALILTANSSSPVGAQGFKASH